MNTVVFISACVALAIIALVAYIRYKSEQKKTADKKRMAQYMEKEPQSQPVTEKEKSDNYDGDLIHELVAASEDASVVDVPHNGPCLPSGRPFPSDEQLYNITREELESYGYADFGWLYHRVCQNWYMAEDSKEQQTRWQYVLVMLNDAFDMLD